ncbi:ExeA family protein [Candidatus Uabimicrobium sp. HlEnr_7]|uniref:ExeA family protein n=1 Tax=Candidatus Uabimicrobium helgolandensis TaxID=3095367 RepID=UPI003558ADE0
MYESYWNLLEKPFQNISDPKFLFYGETYEEAYIRLLYSVTESKGLMLLTGEGGNGKTFVCKNFCRETRKQGYQVAFIANPDLEPIEFLQSILSEFNLDYKNKSKLELFKELENFILENAKNGSTTIIVVDEAQSISNQKTLEEVCVLLNIDCIDRIPINVVLAGKPELSQTVLQVPSLYERVGLRYRLRPLNLHETGEYILFRLDKAGCQRDIFTADAVKEVYEHTNGLPRKINNICDLALLLGYGEGSIVVDKHLIKKAVEDLKGNVYSDRTVSA